MQTTIANWICDQYLKALDTTDAYQRGLELGKALHTIADLYCPAHVTRNFSNGEILRFQDYNAQDPARHAKGDDPDSSPYVERCYNAAVAASTELLKMFRADSASLAKADPKDRPDMIQQMRVTVKNWLVGDLATGKIGPLTLAPNAVNGGTSADYARARNSGPTTAVERMKAAQ
jgi:hypothetical protein